ncbi:MAG: SRPBCC family protein [Saprospiraceae bacterium]|nr:SRPBCC family protein [Saprospiraceae bacterium]
MKYHLEVDINVPLFRAIDLFKDPNNMDKWMEGLQHFEHIRGQVGQVGAKSMLKFKMGRREIEMIETIIVNKLPEEFTGTYEAKGVFNIVKNRFIAMPDNSTKYITEQEFKFTGFMRILGFLMPGAFKNQSQKYMRDFKRFAENSEPQEVSNLT